VAAVVVAAVAVAAGVAGTSHVAVAPGMVATTG